MSKAPLSAARSGRSDGPRRGRFPGRRAGHVGRGPGEPSWPTTISARITATSFAAKSRCHAVNYSRDAIVLGLAYYATDDVRLYGEADWGVIHADVTEPWAFQFGVEYSPARPSMVGSPFLAVGAHLRQEIDFSGNLVVQAGWQWRGNSGHLVRTGLHYHNGLSNQFELFNQFEHQIGLGLWYDF